ncbi:anti-sigma regulatory factor [Nocardioides daphniae]|uniref:Anti-sigma regulatory factor n=1 Tax=Nocardioides daphniae TaxID=402297 RepID=A0ABQ1QIZ0_9ACTN|nr:anti-sigma regulatory factor [Nocardioides daphniae]
MDDRSPAATTTAQVRMSVPADSAFVYVLRSTAASMAARLDFTLDDIEDLRIAVGEAAALLVASATPGADLECTFAVTPGEVNVTLSTPSDVPLAVVTDSFAWQVLTTLTTSCTSTHDAGFAVVNLQVNSILPPEPQGTVA